MEQPGQLQEEQEVENKKGLRPLFLFQQSNSLINIIRISQIISFIEQIIYFIICEYFLRTSDSLIASLKSIVDPGSMTLNASL